MGDVQVSFRAPAEHIRIIAEAAQREDRTLSAELRRIVRHYVDHLVERRKGGEDG